MDAKDRAEKVSQLMLDKKADDVVILDLRELTPISDFFIICSASSDTQVKAISDHIVKEMSKEGEKPWHNEGYKNLSWVLIDFVDIVAHIFLKESRKFYNLEGLWGDAPVIAVKDEVSKA